MDFENTELAHFASDYPISDSVVVLENLAPPEGKTGGTFTWTAAADLRLTELFQQKITYDEVAEILAREFGARVMCRKQVGMRANMLGMKRNDMRFWPTEHTEELKRLFDDKAQYSISIIAEMMNAKLGTSYTRNSVIGRCHRMGLRRDFLPMTVRTPTAPRSYTPRKLGKPGKPVLRVVSSHPRIQKIPVEVARLRCAEVVTRDIDLLDLERNDCRWPAGDNPYTFCGHAKRSGSSYCEAHFQLSVCAEPRGRIAANGWARR